MQTFVDHNLPLTPSNFQLPAQRIMSQSGSTGPITLTYSTVGKLDIKLDAYIPPDASASALPGIIYFHGGGLTTGSRRDILFCHWLLGMWLIVVPAKC